MPTSVGFGVAALTVAVGAGGLVGLRAEELLAADEDAGALVAAGTAVGEATAAGAWVGLT